MDTSKNVNTLEAYTIKLNDYIVGISWSFDNQYLCVGLASGEAIVVSASDQKIILAFKAHDNGIIAIAHSSTNHVFITAGQDGFLSLWDTRTGQLLKRLEGGWQWVEHIQWAPDGNYFIAGSGKHLKLFSKSGELMWHFINPESTISGLSWHHGSKSFAIGSYGNLKLFNISSPIPTQILPWQNSLISLAWSPDGNFICGGTQDSRIHFWPLPYIEESDCEMTGYASKVKNLAWNFTSQWLASNCGQEIVLWEIMGQIPVGQTPLVLQGHKHRVSALSFANKSEILVSGDNQGVFLFWHPKKYANFINGGTIEGSISVISWSANDEYIAVATSQGELAIVDMPV